MFPVLSSHQDDKEAVKRILRRSIISSSFIHFPLMIGLAVIAKPLVILLMTEKWLPAVPFVQIFCLSHLLDPLCSSNAQAIISMGYSGTYLKLNLIRKALGIIVLITTAFWGVYAIAIGQALDGIIASIVNSYPNKKLLSYRYLEQIRDVLPSFLLSLCMGAIVYFAKFLTLPAILLIIIQVITGGILYLGLAWLFRLKSYEYLKSSAKEFWAGTSRNNSTKKIQNDSEKDSA
jgi:O-antigen/teichoic acid export membrane protein